MKYRLSICALLFKTCFLLASLPAAAVDAGVMSCDPSKIKADGSASDGQVIIDDKAVFLAGTKWPQYNIHVCWENLTPENKTERDWVRTAVENTWQKHSRITFSGWGACTPKTWGIRILIEDSGPHTKDLGCRIAFASNSTTSDCEMAMQRDDLIRSNGMVLNFTFQNWDPACDGTREQCIRTIAVHEFGHALGFAHEQTRHDTPGECKKNKKKHVANDISGDTPLTRWDPDSVMNYCNPNQKQEHLSECDIFALQKIYWPPR